VAKICNLWKKRFCLIILITGRKRQPKHQDTLNGYYRFRYEWSRVGRSHLVIDHNNMLDDVLRVNSFFFFFFIILVLFHEMSSFYTSSRPEKTMHLSSFQLRKIRFIIEPIASQKKVKNERSLMENPMGLNEGQFLSLIQGYSSEGTMWNVIQ
jgi:hypothetical protein